MVSQGTRRAQQKFSDYDSFTEKFKPKKTTDDCYTPPAVYDAVLDWVKREYDKGEAQVVRPFYPGGDFENFDYPPGCIVVDNPPFSILTPIVNFYEAQGVKYFLFAPYLTFFQIRNATTKIICNVKVTYENGAIVNTSFLTNLDDPDVLVRTAPELCAALKQTQKSKKRRAKIEFPRNVISSTHIKSSIIEYVPLTIRRDEAVPVSTVGKRNIFGGGYIISDSVVERLAAAEERAYRAQEKDRGERFAEEYDAKIIPEKYFYKILTLTPIEQEIARRLNMKE